jgi:1,2-phenylacetyl-CoA epoxidase PaaB subunit
MSKIREKLLSFADDLPPPTPDTRHWVIYTKKRPDAEYKWAGLVDAPDADLALQYAREHYGLDEVCIGILAHDKSDAVDGEYAIGTLKPGDASGDDGIQWAVFTLDRRGGNHQSAGTIVAPDAETAIQRARTTHASGGICSLRVVPSAKVHETTAEELPIWRSHDMTYKLARGYSKDVRAKWTNFRDEKTYEQYRKGDIADHF